ncbi:hypothetical protein [Niveispirillum sp. KHB5.9]|uniref:hypothetical protein n=1 Tax=Niveispirillum sp. KHB5.9 TaxID=3400269 RepID=UPI003A8B0665
MAGQSDRSITPQTATGDLLSRLLPMYRQDTGRMSDQERDAFLDERERLTWALAQKPGQGTADMAAKLAILCRRLRGDLGRSCTPGPVADYLLAESIRADMEGMG